MHFLKRKKLRTSPIKMWMNLQQRPRFVSVCVQFLDRGRKNKHPHKVLKSREQKGLAPIKLIKSRTCSKKVATLLQINYYKSGYLERKLKYIGINFCPCAKLQMYRFTKTACQLSTVDLVNCVAALKKAPNRLSAKNVM